MANKGYKFRLYPTLEQEAYLAKCFGCSRFVYNPFLRLTTDAYAELKKHLRYGDTAKLLTLLKKDKQYSWLTEVNSQSLQQTLKDLESAFVRFFRKLGDVPVFKKKRNRQLFRVPQQRLLVARAHEKVANQRLDMQHKLSLQLTWENQVLAVEDLHIKGMVKNHKLAQAISDAACDRFFTMLEYKGKLYGCEIRKLDRFFPSSKRCSKCGYIHENLTLDIREWTCPECSTHHDRDLNASINTLIFSDPQIRQELPKSTPKEPVERQGYQGGYSLGLGSCAGRVPAVIHDNSLYVTAL